MCMCVYTYIGETSVAPSGKPEYVRAERESGHVLLSAGKPLGILRCFMEGVGSEPACRATLIHRPRTA